MAPVNNAGIFRRDFLLRVDSLTRALEKIRHVRQVMSPTNLKTMSMNGLLPVQTRVLHFEDEGRYTEDSISIYNSQHLVGSFFPADARSLTLFIKTEYHLSKKASDELASDIEKTIRRFSFNDVHTVGRIFAQKVYLDLLAHEFVLFLCLSFVLVVLFLWISFRSFYGIAVPVLVVVVGIVWTLGIMEATGKAIDLMTIMLPTMIFITGMSDVVHFFSKYFEEMAAGTPKQRIYPLILREVGFPTFLTLITTVVGFLSLLFSSIRPVREFGIYTSAGVAIAFVLTYTLLPALLHFFVPRKLVTVHGGEGRTQRAMRGGLFWIFRHQKLIVGIATLVTLLSVAGIMRIRVNNLLLEDLTESNPVKQDFNFFDRHYSGVRPFELQVKMRGAHSVWDYDVMRQLARLDSFVKREYDAGFLISAPGLVKSIYAGTIEGYHGEFPAPDDYAPIAKLLKANRKNRDIRRLVTPNGRETRISAKIRDIGSMEVTQHNERLMAFIRNNIDSRKMEFTITGAAHLIDRNNSYMVVNMVQGFLFSILVIGLLTFFLHRSWRMVLVFIIPNALPVLIIGGIMGFAGIELKAATSLVFSIAFGIATDDTIHFISRLKIERGYGKTLLYAFKRTYFETGKPIMLTTFILFGGFMSLMTSGFQSVFYFGFLICITVLIALLADIFLLPVLLFLVYGRGRR